MMTMRDPSVRRWLMPWLLGAMMGAACAAQPGLAARVTARAEILVARNLAALLAAPAEAAETLRFRSVPRESESVIARDLKRHAVRVRVDEPDTTDSSAPEPPSAPNPPGLVITRSGDVMRVGSDIHIEKDEVVKGDVTALKGDVTVDGHVEGNVVAMFGDVYLNSSARVDGDVVCMRGELHEQEGAVVSGQRVTALSEGGRLRTERARERHRHAASVGAMIVVLIIFTAVAWGAALLTPGRLVSSLQTLRAQPMLSFGITMLVVALAIPSLIALSIVVALLCITVIGIPLAMAALLAYALFYVAMGAWGWATGAALIGRWISARRGDGSEDIRRWALFGSLVIMGWILVAAILASAGAGSALGGFGVFLCVIGWITFGVISWFGAGAWVRSEFTTGFIGVWWAKRRRRAEPIGPTTPPAATPPAEPPAAPEAPLPPPPPPPSPPEAFRPPGSEPPPPLT